MSDELKNSSGEDEQEKRESDMAAASEAEQTMDHWSRAYGSYGVHKPHHFIGSISEIMKKLPQGLQISRVWSIYSGVWHMYCVRRVLPQGSAHTDREWLAPTTTHRV